MLINISSDSVYLYYEGKSQEIPRGHLELELPNTLKKLHDTGEIGNAIYVINGPGSFTNMRIGCLCLNMYKEIQQAAGNSVDFYTIDKISLFTYLYNQYVLTGTGLIYIGQQKNAWSMDRDGVIDKVALDLGSEYAWIDCYSGSQQDDRIVRFALKDDVLTISGSQGLHTCNPADCGFVQVDQLIPNYMMDPNIQKKG